MGTCGSCSSGAGPFSEGKELRGGRVCLDRQKRFISDKLPVHIAACFLDNVLQ
jgi:hypothetical protein